MAENSNFLPTFFHIFGNLSLKDLAYLLLVTAVGLAAFPEHHLQVPVDLTGDAEAFAFHALLQFCALHEDESACYVLLIVNGRLTECVFVPYFVVLFLFLFRRQLHDDFHIRVEVLATLDGIGDGLARHSDGTVVVKLSDKIDHFIFIGIKFWEKAYLAMESDIA